MSMFSRSRSTVTDFGNTTMPSSMCQRSTTWAGVLPCDSAIATIAGSSSTSALRDRAPRLGHDAAVGVLAAQAGLLEVGVQLDLVDRRA